MDIVKDILLFPGKPPDVQFHPGFFLRSNSYSLRCFFRREIFINPVRSSHTPLGTAVKICHIIQRFHQLLGIRVKQQNTAYGNFPSVQKHASQKNHKHREYNGNQRIHTIGADIQTDNPSGSLEKFLPYVGIKSFFKKFFFVQSFDFQHRSGIFCQVLAQIGGFLGKCLIILPHFLIYTVDCQEIQGAHQNLHTAQQKVSGQQHADYDDNFRHIQYQHQHADSRRFRNQGTIIHHCRNNVSRSSLIKKYRPLFQEFPVHHGAHLVHQGITEHMPYPRLIKTCSKGQKACESNPAEFFQDFLPGGF